MRTCRACGCVIEHHGSICTRCWRQRQNSTPQANAAADLAAFWLTRPLGMEPQKMAVTRKPERAGPGAA